MHNTDRTLTTHVGSLVRPRKLREILERRCDGEFGESSHWAAYANRRASPVASGVPA